MSDCDICKLEFPSSVPNVAIADVALGGPWGYVCEAHLANATYGVFISGLRPCHKCKLPTKQVLAGKAHCTRKTCRP